MSHCTGKWVIQVKGKKCSKSWEISVVREDARRSQKEWGWFDEDKLLISHNGGPCHLPIVEFVWDAHIVTATALCEKLNKPTEKVKKHIWPHGCAGW